MAANARPNWADEVGDDDVARNEEDKDVTTVVEYRTNEDGKKVKITRKIKRTVVKVKANHAVAERKKWRKFGEARNDPPGPHANTTQIGEQQLLTLTTSARTLDAPENEAAPTDMKASLAKAKIMCRICKGDHWTTKCPFKDSHVPLSELENVISGTGPETSLTPEPSMPDASRGGPGKYVPPSMRNRGEGEGPAGDSMERRDRRDDYFTVRVSNLSEDANEDDLHAMFRKVGHIARVFCSRDKETGLCRGFAFVSYYNQADAEKAIAKLSGQGYDNLIMRVEMAQDSKRPERPDRR